jgi:hypothetical protein
LLVHLPWEAKVGGHAQFRWMYSQERELKKLRVTVHNKVRVEGCIVEEFTCRDYELLKQVFFTCQQCECYCDAVPHSGRSSVE